MPQYERHPWIGHNDGSHVDDITDASPILTGVLLNDSDLCEASFVTCQSSIIKTHSQLDPNISFTFQT